MPVTIQGITFYTVQETAKELRVTAQTIRTYVKQNKLKGKRIGLPLYITEDNIREFLTSEDKPVENNIEVDKSIQKNKEVDKHGLTTEEREFLLATNPELLNFLENTPKRYERKKK